MVRPPRLEFPGAIYHVIARGNEGNAIFRDERDREEYLARLAHYRRRFRFELLAYCLMTNHVHLAIRTGEAPLSRAMGSLQSAYATWFNRRHERLGHLFAGRYKAILVQGERYFFTLVSYIHHNPVQKRMTDRADAYPWSSARYLFGTTGSPPFDRDTTLALLGLSVRPGVTDVRRLFAAATALEYERLPEVNRLVKGEKEFAVGRIEASGRVRDAWKGVSERVVVAAISRVTGVSISAMLGRARGAEVRAARALAAYVGKRYAGISLSRTASHLGREASCLCKPVAALEIRIENEPEYRRRIDRLVTRLRRVVAQIAES